MSDVILPEALVFEWDSGNSTKSWLKHKISIEEAEEVFYDAKRLLLEDIRHSKLEKRFIIYGKTKEEKRLFIVFTLRARDIEKIRIISARVMKRKERDMYEKAINFA